MAAQIWPGQNPIGQKVLQQTGRAPEEQRTLEVVGVARNAKYATVSEKAPNFIYVPMAQQFQSEVTFYARRPAGSSRIAELRKAVSAFDPMLPVIHTQTLKAATAFGLLPQRLAAWIAGVVGTIGLFLAAFGLYGLTAFSVAQRAREIAVRMALGASREAVLSLVLRQSARLALIGTTIGLGLAIAASSLLGSLLVGIGAVDPLAFGIATVLLSAVLLAASWAPAQRASRMDPMLALRSE
jgi:putative ABC transport system permease protein